VIKECKLKNLLYETNDNYTRRRINWLSDIFLSIFPPLIGGSFCLGTALNGRVHSCVNEEKLSHTIQKRDRTINGPHQCPLPRIRLICRRASVNLSQKSSIH
jgi:hypothetical protein